MAGTWTYTGAVAPISEYQGNSLDVVKADAFPTLGASNAGWTQTLFHKWGVEFARELAARNKLAATCKVSANNGAGDTNGVGATFTITIITT